MGFSVPNKVICRADTQAKHFGGLAVILNKNLQISFFNCASNDNAEICEIAFSNLSFRIINVYYKRGIINDDTLNIIKINPNFDYIILEDFNATHKAWGFSTNRGGELLLNWINKNDLIFLNEKKGTYIKSDSTLSCIDMFLCTKNFSKDISWDVAHATFGSDHYPMALNVGSHGGGKDLDYCSFRIN